MVSKLTHPRSKRRKKIFLFLKEEIEELCGAVENLAPFVVYQSRCWTRAGGPNADLLLPNPTICGKYAPLSEIGRKVVTLECFIERTTQVIFGQPTGRACSAQPVKSLRGIRSMGMHATCPAQRNKRRL